ncbi:DUF1963 domain-containing protein [Aeoliella sp.]|uniref:DUF1963 domain-containing protein n=1 Tax=Aeoliella sp. TaxID=2795800 RepID=UPI003CCC29F6
MHEAELKKHELLQYRTEIESTALDCFAGIPVEQDSVSYFGGFPIVDDDFVWPTKKGYPLNFVGQLNCSELDLIPIENGRLLFFYDLRHWGYSPKDLGHAVVLHQQGNNQLEASDLPSCQVKRLFGWLKSTVQPKVYERVNVTIRPERSYPPWMRNSIEFADSGYEEAYAEFCAEVCPEIQFGGNPYPIQNDDMERDCVAAFDYGQPEDWRLLLQLFEVGDMMWGDAGVLYWFIHKDDLRSGRLDRVWMVTQCH